MSISINPQSVLRLLNVSISNDYKHQFDFTSQNEQETFFLNKTHKEFTNLTFVSENEVIIEENYYLAQRYNYLMFKNNGFNENIVYPSWYYAFITDIEFINENSTKITYELDVFQTFYWNISYKPSFIIREHVSDDSIGANTVDEGIGYGDYIINNSNSNNIKTLDSWYYLVVTANTPENQVLFHEYDNIFHGCTIYPKNTIYGVLQVINEFINAGRTLDDIIDIYCVPTFTISVSNDVDTTETHNKLKSGTTGKVENISIGININHTFDGYLPKNNKLRCYPYSVYELTSNQGKSVILKPEMFSNSSQFQFKVESSIMNPCVACFPINYKEFVSAEDTGIVIDNLPHSTWVSDFYKNWLALNSQGNNLSLAINTGSALSGMAIASAMTNPIASSLALTHGATQLATNIGNYLINQRKAEVTPNTVHENSNTMNLQLAMNTLKFRLNHKIIKSEFAQIIDNYFEMYGYKVNRVATPNFRKRTHWDFIQTEGINITANIPTNYLNKIKDMFNNGVTFWHNDNVGNYNRTNSIRS